jgi:hypothetical protein
MPGSNIRLETSYPTALGDFSQFVQGHEVIPPIRKAAIFPTHRSVQCATDSVVKYTGHAVAINAMKARKESRGIAPLILNLGTRWREWSHAPTALLLGDNPDLP